MVPAGLGGVIAVAGGEAHSLALKQDGTVVGWPNGSDAATVPTGLSDVIAIAAGEYHSLALKQDGTVVAWGDNTYGQAAVPAALSGAIAVAAGSLSSLALKQDGTVLAWGINEWGEITAPTGLSGVVAIAAGESCSLALKQDGTVVAWGAGGPGQYGVRDHGQATVPSGLTAVVAVAAGAYHSLALKQDGTVVAWGWNYDYRDHATHYDGQAAVPGGLSGMVAVAAGGFHSLALKSDGTVVAWGDNTYGQATVPGGLKGVIAIAAGWDQSLAVVYPGSLAPTISQSPQTQTAEAGSTVGLYALADGAPPLSCQWCFGGTNALSGMTNSLAALTNVQPSQSGVYVVLITNRFGAVTSDTATLSVIAPAPRRTLPALHLTGDAGSLLHLNHADALGSGASWQALDSFTLTNTPQLYLDLSDPLPPYRFYRAWQTNAPSVTARLDLGMATEITLTGAAGSHVRVDYIHQFGPTGAWVTLDTVTLTNTTQPYFDLTMFRQPPRLYRLVPAP